MIPGKTGRYLTTNKKLDSRTVSLAMWVKDVDPATGAAMGTPEAQLQTNLDTLRQTFATEGTALLKHTMGGTVRQAPAEVLGERGLAGTDVAAHRHESLHRIAAASASSRSPTSPSRRGSQRSVSTTTTGAPSNPAK